MSTAVILIGIPGSGKSTLVREIIKNRSFGIFDSSQIVSPDRIRANLYGSAAVQGDWSEIWQEVQQGFTKIANAKQSVIYDATNSKPEYRRDMINLAQKFHFYPVIGLWLNTPLWLCLVRNQGRDREFRVSDEVIMNMHKYLFQTPPQLSEGFDRLMYKEDKIDSEWID